MGATDLFSHLSYREYLKKEFAGTGEQRGRRSLLAKHLNCQTSFLSQILTDRAHLSLEHAIRTSEFLQHTEAEKNYFMLLVQKGKAGSKDLERFFEIQLEQIRTQRENIKERINVKTELSAEDQMRYYSSWYYAAIHILCALPKLNTVDAISKKLRLDLAIIKNALDFLENRGFVQRKDGAYTIGSARIHLAKGSPMLPRHHSNWRMKAIESVDVEKQNDLHYSALLGIAKKDVPIFKEKLLALIQEFEPIIKESREEVPVVLLMDLFEL
jgi:uncharacterized protein (TIGR02147 family)